jgi:adenosylcobinamide-GDP ribazoletransferase
MISSFALALSFLTVLRVPLLPVRLASPAELAASFACFPIVGAILGGLWATFALSLRPVFPPALVAGLLTLMMALVTRGLHLDGLADLADGVGGGYTAEKRLEIMKDSRIGTFGAVALILILTIKIAALQTLVQTNQWRILLLVPLLSRLGMVLTAYRSAYPRPEGGLGKSFCEQLSLGHLLAALGLAAIAGAVIAPLLGGFLLAALVAQVVLLRVLAKRWLGGITGDVLGACNEISEALLLTLAIPATAMLPGL